MKQRPFPHRRLCCPRGSIGTTTASDALPARRPFPGLRLSDDDAPARTAAAGPGRASPVPAATFRTFRALYAGEFLGAAIQVLRSFRGLRRERLGSALPSSHLAAGTLTARQASLDAADRSVAPPERALDAGLRPDPFPGRAASLLPGLLAATRTGLSPAGGDELMLDQLFDQHLQLWARLDSSPTRPGLRWRRL